MVIGGTGNIYVSGDWGKARGQWRKCKFSAYDAAGKCGCGMSWRNEFSYRAHWIQTGIVFLMNPMMPVRSRRDWRILQPIKWSNLWTPHGLFHYGWQNESR